MSQTWQTQNRYPGAQVLGDEYDSEDNSLGSVVERFETPITVYLCSDDVVALIERLDGYAGDSGWNLVTLDRTNDGKFYAFLSRMGH